VTVIDDSTMVTNNLGSASAVIDSYLGGRPVYLLHQLTTTEFCGSLGMSVARNDRAL
jgi:phage gp36-like protein